VSSELQVGSRYANRVTDDGQAIQEGASLAAIWQLLRIEQSGTQPVGGWIWRRGAYSDLA
jgi:hypothetical protein